MKELTQTNLAKQFSVLEPFFPCSVVEQPEAYSELCQTSKMERFARIVNGFQKNYFHKKLLLRCLAEF